MAVQTTTQINDELENYATDLSHDAEQLRRAVSNVIQWVGGLDRTIAEMSGPSGVEDRLPSEARFGKLLRVISELVAVADDLDETYAEVEEEIATFEQWVLNGGQPSAAADAE